MLTVEYLTADGLDDHLPHAGIAVHLVDQSPPSCGRPASGAACTGIDRQQLTLGSTAPHLDLLHTAGQTWQVEGWTITVRRTITDDDATAQVEVRATQR